MQAFYDQILKADANAKISPLEKYIENVKKLYFPLDDYKSIEIRQHYEFLIRKYDNVDFAKEIRDYNIMFIETKSEQGWNDKEVKDFLEWKDLLTVPKLSKQDFEISRILKANSFGLSITISPQGNLSTWRALLDKFQSIKCPHIRKGSGFYYIEFFTNGHTEGRPHIHAYFKVENNKKTIARIRAYYTQIFKNTANVAVFQKKDISYGLGYLTAKDSSPAKQAMKLRDAAFRLENGIDSIFHY